MNRHRRIVPLVIAALVGGSFLPPALALEPPVQISPQRVIELPEQFEQGQPPVITSVILSPRGDLMATAGDDHLVRIWNASTGKMLRKLRGHDDWVRTLAFHPSGEQLASAGDDGRIVVWNVMTGEAAHRIGGRLPPPTRPAPVPSTPSHRNADCIYRVIYSPDGSLLAAAGFQDTVRLYNAATGRLERTLNCSAVAMRALKFSPDGSLLAAGGRNGQIRIWRPGNGAVVRDLSAGPHRIRALAFSADGDRLAVGGDGPFLRLWDVSDGAEVKAFVSRPGRVMSLVFCGDDLVATGSSDNLIRVWSLDSESEVYRLVGHHGSVSALEFNPAEQTLLSGSFDTTICFWKLPTEPRAATARGPAGRTNK